MLNNVIVDCSSLYSPYETKLISILYLLADNVYEVGDIVLQTGERSASKIKDDCEIICKDGAIVKPLYGAPLLKPKLPFGLEYKNPESAIFIEHSKANNLDDEVVFTKKGWVRKAYIASQGLTSRTCLMLLAAAGLEVTLPNAFIENKSSDELIQAKEKLYGERQVYLNAISKLAAESYERVLAGEYGDIIAWSRNEANIKILPKSIALQESLKKLDKNILHRLGVSFIKDGIPAIGQALSEEGINKSLSVAAIEFLKILSGSLAKSIEGRKAPEVNYGLKIMKVNKGI